MSEELTIRPYRSLLVCRNAAWDEDDEYWNHLTPDDMCDWVWRCGTCHRIEDGTPCPEHAPVQVPGLRLIECDAMPPHPRTWVLDDDGYEPGCPWCQVAAAMTEHAPCAHSHHRAWRRWRVTHKAWYWLTLAGIVTGGWSSYTAHCRGCMTNFRLGRSGYLLGWPRWKWSCLLRGHHRPGAEVADGICGKCAPCPDCGSPRLAHEPACEWAASVGLLPGEEEPQP